MKHYFLQKKNRGYTLIETLVASAVMMVAVGAASSLSLSMVTQEEMSERTVRVMNHLENVATLYQLGLDSADIANIIPVEPCVTNLTYTSVTESVTGLGNVDMMEIKVSYNPASATSENQTGTLSWTGGEHTKSRDHTIRVLRSNP
jgi:type II secretory pathway pseudopilin PulG